MPARFLDNPNLAGGLSNFGCAVLYGNDPIVLDAFFFKLLCNMYNKDKIITRQNELYTYSDHHFEFDFDSDAATHVQTILGLKRSKSINGEPHLVYIKNLPKNRCKHLHHIIDTLGNNMVMVLATRSLIDIDENIRSRAIMLNLSLDREKVFNFCKDHIKPDMDCDEFDDAYSRSLGNIVGTVLRLECGASGRFAYEESISKTIDTMQKTKSFLTAVTTMRETAYKIFHMNVPFAAVCKVVLDRFKGSAKQGSVAECCAAHEHMISMTYKDLFVYERFFVEIMQLAKQPEPKMNAKQTAKMAKEKPVKPDKQKKEEPNTAAMQPANTAAMQPVITAPAKKGRKTPSEACPQPKVGEGAEHRPQACAEHRREGLALTPAATAQVPQPVEAIKAADTAKPVKRGRKVPLVAPPT